MREIKFRAWDSEKEEMAKVISIGGEDITLQDDEGDIWDSVMGYIAYPMQYTGIKDKNDVEIYEGDIVIKSQFGYDGTFQVLFVEESSGFFLKDAVSELWSMGSLNPIEVIGNIYENPELLNR
ncbi:YopX family protein [Exiguobacterium sp. S22-S28]|uniref:YopX family protein n=1 Tax=Exiguobacterium sp. S22-S28 TaxID=3342768 RepID=UPI00372D1198